MRAKLLEGEFFFKIPRISIKFPDLSKYEKKIPENSRFSPGVDILIRHSDCSRI